MSAKIGGFKINGLNGRVNISISITDNRLILVGENGTGKSTVVTILYYLLTKQWVKLSDYRFESMAISIDGELYEVTKEQLRIHIELISERKNSTRISYEVSRTLDRLNVIAEDVIGNDELERLAYQEIRRRGIHFPKSRLLQVLEELVSAKSQSARNAEVKRLENVLSKKFDTPIIFLPTYRRIERDLKAIFPELEDEIRESIDLSHQGDVKNHLEFVEFGMEDVSSLVARTMEELKDEFRGALDALTAEYLRDVLRENYLKVDIAAVKEIKAETLDFILSRIDDSILSQEDQQLLRAKVANISGQQSDLVVAHFLTKLNALHEKQRDKEKKVRAFIGICNEYLVGKYLKFNDVTFSMNVYLGSALENQNPIDRDKIEFEMLSSGEKQIVSLFSHLYLSDQRNYFLIIDEPELSLSVPWQRRFLPDISNSEQCAGLIAVTHSPFIYENELEIFAKGLGEFVEVVQ